MDLVLLIILVLLTGIVSSILYLNLKSKTKDEKENKEAEVIATLSVPRTKRGTLSKEIRMR